MPSSDEWQSDQEAGSVRSSYGETLKSTVGVTKTLCTVKDVARLAGVSTATVSRVVNRIGTVSDKRRMEVLIAVSKLQYFPNAHAVELGRSGGRIPKKRDIHMPIVGSRTGTLNTLSSNDSSR